MFFGLRKWEFTSPTVLNIPGAGPRINLSRLEELDTVNGWAIVQQDSPIGSDGISFGEGLTLNDVVVTQSIKDSWYTALGTRPEGDTLDQFLFDHMEAKADPTGTDTARPLELADGLLEIWLGTRQKKLVPLVAGTRDQRAAFVRITKRVRDRLNELRGAVDAGLIPSDMHRKVLSLEANKLGINPNTLKPKNWRNDESPLPPETTISDSFTSFTNYTKVTGAGTWTCNNGLYVYREFYQALLDTIKHNTALSGSNNWSDLTIQSANGLTLGNGTGPGPICRLGSNGSACYHVSVNINGGGGFTPQMLRFASASNTVTHLAWYDVILYATYGTLIVIRIKATGSTITSFVTGNGNTSTIYSATDTVVSSGLYAGIGCQDVWGSGYANIKVANAISISDGQAAAPTISTITPNTGSTDGGTDITITGTGFSGASVTVDGVLCTNISTVSSTVITATTPSGTVGAKDVVVTNGDSQSVTSTGGFTYFKTIKAIARRFLTSFAFARQF